VNPEIKSDRSALSAKNFAAPALQVWAMFLEMERIKELEGF